MPSNAPLTEDRFEINHEAMQSSCANWGVPNNSEEEMTDLKAAIVTIGQRSSIDPRFILAIIMQESTGCVRVVSTMGVHPNPGLMQSHQGYVPRVIHKDIANNTTGPELAIATAWSMVAWVSKAREFRYLARIAAFSRWFRTEARALLRVTDWLKFCRNKGTLMFPSTIVLPGFITVAGSCLVGSWSRHIRIVVLLHMRVT